MKKRLPHIILEEILSEGVGFIFGVTGKGISPLIDGILDYSGLEFIGARHESGASLMAYGYAQSSGRLGVCCGTTAGGVTNLATGVATAYMNSVPMLVITGQSSSGEYGKGAFQESTGLGQSIHAVDFFKAITKESFALSTPHLAGEAIRYAIKSAWNGRKGPVHISIPFDYFLSSSDWIRPDRVTTIFREGITGVNGGIVRAVDLIRESRRPVFLAGWGAVLSGAQQGIVEIASRLGVPVATTPQGKGAIPGHHPLSLGVMGVAGHECTKEYIFEKSDLLLAVGTNFDEFTSLNWNQGFLNNKIIQIDIDNREVGKNYPVDMGLVGDAKTIINSLLTEIHGRGMKEKPSAKMAKEFIASGQKYANPKLMDDPSSPVKPQRLMKAVGDYTPDNTLFLADSGAHWAWATHYLKVGENGGFFPTIGLAAMGASLCAAIGVKVSKPQHPVVCICGDGAFLMNGNEVSTAAQYNIPVIWIVLNDARYNLPATSLRKMFNREIGVALPQTNFARLAQVYGARGYRTDDPGQLETIINKAIKSNKPTVIDVAIDPDEIPPVGQRKLDR